MTRPTGERRVFGRLHHIDLNHARGSSRWGMGTRCVGADKQRRSNHLRGGSQLPHSTNTHAHSP